MLIRVANPNDVKEAHRVRMSVVENPLTRTVITEKDYVDAITVTGRGWVAEIDGVVRGFAVGNRINCSVWALFVEPEFEGQGIGRALHDAVMTWMRAEGCKTVWLETGEGTRAETFYGKAGWKRVSTSDGDVRFEIETT